MKGDRSETEGGVRDSKKAGGGEIEKRELG